MRCRGAKQITGKTVAATTALVMMACVHPQPDVGSGVVELSPFWSASVRAVPRDSDPAAPGADAMRGEVMMVPGAKSNETMVQLGIVNSAPGMSLVWHVHHGPCRLGGKTVGPASNYPPLVTNPSGRVGTRVILPFPTPTDGQYHVDVHRSSASPERIVLCGELQRLS